MAQASTKRVAIDKANAQMVSVVAAAAFISVFSLIAAHAILGQIQYQSRVVSAKQKANIQLLADFKVANQLVSSYDNFNSGTANVIGGQTAGSGQNDGDNTKIVLDALPDTYNFPALTSSIEKILNDRHLKISDISGTDDQLNQQANVTSNSPKAVAMPFSFSVTNATYPAVQDLVNALQNSIRPIQVTSLTISGGAADMTLQVNAQTYYQPSKNLNIKKEVIK